MLKKLMYWLLFIVIILGVFNLFYNGRVNLGLTALCFDTQRGFYECK